MSNLWSAANSVKRSAYLSQLAQVTPGFPPMRAPARVWTTPERMAGMADTMNSAGNCVSPIPIQLMANEYNGREPDPVGAYTCRMSVRCRKCPECREQAARMWMARAISEASGAPRTWFATLTFDWKTKPVGPSSQWTYARRQFTLFAKRLRKKGCSFRYLAVFEAHKDGRPHIHCLLHEKKQSSVLWQHVDQAWSGQGFHKTKLVRASSRDPDAAVDAARYVTKYLFKDQGQGAICRIRASIRYGKTEHAATDTDRRQQHSVVKRSVSPPGEGTIPHTATWRGPRGGGDPLPLSCVERETEGVSPCHFSWHWLYTSVFRARPCGQF